MASAFKQCCQIPGLVQLIKNIVLNLIFENGYAASIIFGKNATKSENVRTSKLFIDIVGFLSRIIDLKYIYRI